MKKQNIYSALILTALLTAGCAKEMGNTPDSIDNSAIELSSVSTDPMTKAVITGTSFTTDEAATGTQQTLSKSAATTLECLVVPVASESGTPEFTVSCTIDGKFYSKTFTGDVAALAKGNQTSIEFTVLNTGITVDGIFHATRDLGSSVRLVTDVNYTPAQQRRYTVSFYPKDGVAPDPVMVNAGATIAKPADPVLPGYVLKGWYKDFNKEYLWDFDTDIVTRDIVLFPDWEEEGL